MAEKGEMFGNQYILAKNRNSTLFIIYKVFIRCDHTIMMESDGILAIILFSKLE